MALLEGKRLLVSGVINRYSIAYAIARAAKEHGAQVALTYQTSDRLREKVGRLAEEDFSGAPLVALDVSSDEQCDSAFAQIKEDLGGLDGLVHSIAYAPREALSGAYHEVTEREAFATALDVSAYSFTAMAKRASDLLTPGSCLLTLTYLGANRAIPNYNVMGVAKAALESSVRYLAASLGSEQLRVNAISAGPIKTLASSGIGSIGKMIKAVAEQSALRRNVTREEVADAAVFLLSPMAAAITGEVLHVDAGHNFMLGVPDQAA